MKGQFEENPALAQERLLTLNEARNHFPVRLSLSAIWRKIRKGSRGVKLETIYLGRRYTSVEAIARYIERTQCGNHRDAVAVLKKPCVKQIDQGLLKHGIIQNAESAEATVENDNSRLVDSLLGLNGNINTKR